MHREYSMGGNEGLFSAAPSNRARGNGHELQHSKFHLNYFNHEGSQTPAQVAQKGCGTSTHKDSQNPAGCGPRQTALAGTAWQGGRKREAGLDDLRRPLSISMTVCLKAGTFSRSTHPAPLSHPVQFGTSHCFLNFNLNQMIPGVCSIQLQDITKAISNCNCYKFLSKPALTGMYIPS